MEVEMPLIESTSDPNRPRIVIDRPAYDKEQFDKKYSTKREEKTLDVKTEVQNFCTKEKFITSFLSFFPILGWLPKYKLLRDLPSDIIGGLTVGIMHIPQGMAYGTLASLLPVHGLYTSFFPALFYMFFSTSKHNSVGVFAIICIMVSNVRLRVLPGEIDDFLPGGNKTADMGYHGFTPVEVVTALTFTVGIAMFIMALLRLHFLTTYLSDQVISGFTTGAACHVFTAQVDSLFGIKIPRYNGIGNQFRVYIYLFSSITKTNLATLLISFVTITFLVIGKECINPKFKRRFRIPIPFELIVVVLGTTFSYLLKLRDRYDVEIVDYIPTGLPAPVLPKIELVPLLIGDAIGIAIIIFVISVSLGKFFGKRHNYKFDPGQELYALSLMEVICSLFSCIPASTALARSLVYEAAGNKSQLATIFSCSLLFIVLMWVGPLLEPLPTCVLSSIIAVALKGMFMQFRELKVLWPASKIDFSIWLVSFLATVILDIRGGLAISVVFALLTIVCRSQWPDSYSMVKLENTELFQPTNDGKAQAITIFRFESPLIFTNVENFRKQLNDHMNLGDSGKEWAILDCSAVTYIDYSGIVALRTLFEELDETGVKVAFAGCNAAVSTMFERTDIYSKISRNHFYPSIQDAHAYVLANRSTEE